MRVIPPLAITTAMITEADSNVKETVPTAWNSGTAYTLGAFASAASSNNAFNVYQNLVEGNTNHAVTDTSWWRWTGVAYGAYNAGTTYALNDRVADLTNHNVYRSLAGGNIGNALSDATKWLLVSRTNLWQLFDYDSNGKMATGANGTFQFTLKPATRVDAIAMTGLVADSFSIEIIDNATVSTVYTNTLNLKARQPASWYEFFFTPFSYKRSFALFDLPPVANGSLIIQLTSTTSNVIQCESLVVGKQVYIGCVQYGAESDAINYSTITRDFAGDIATITKRRNVIKTNQTIFTKKNNVNIIISLRNVLNANAAIWSGLNGEIDNDYFESLLILGFARKFTINDSYVEHALVQLEIEEL
jgi:hypothetical protein